MKIGKENRYEVSEFCYLGSNVTEDELSKKDIKCRIMQAKKAVYKKINLF